MVKIGFKRFLEIVPGRTTAGFVTIFSLISSVCPSMIKKYIRQEKPL
jgi:hypothetical protein